jgi:uncharacterized LabA/DUF88 family protein
VAPRGCDPGVFAFLEANVNRCAFLVDGLNLYHSALDAERATRRSLRRLDIATLCRSYLHALPGRSAVTSVMYFSAVAHHRESRHPGTVARQVGYFTALEATGVQPHLGHFKAKSQVCPLCGGRFVGWEEKETDVAIGARLLELICRDLGDTVVLVTGDTDLVPPYRRVNRELSRCADRALTIRVASYARNQLPAG